MGRPATGRGRRAAADEEACVPGKLKHAGHLIRPAVVLLLGFALFLLVRGAVVPATFGELGHYRAASLDEIRQQAPAFAGQAVCAGCHAGVTAVRASGKHRAVACEACHGPSARHAADPAAVRHAPLDVVALCAGCHEKDSAKPKWFRQVESKEHSGGAPCQSCHQPHKPEF